jgi:molybdopterin biosynthesis enzyme
METYYYQFIQRRTFRLNIIMLTAGSSAGSEDFISAFMEEHGELLVHGITVMP